MEVLGIHDEVRAAFRTRTVRVAGFELHAPSMGHVLALSVHAPLILSRSVPVDQVAAAAAVLAIPPEKLCKWQDPCPALRPLGHDALKPVLDAILDLFGEAFECSVPAGDSTTASGVGWWLELYYFAAHELRMDHQAILACPIARLFALATASAEFNGLEFRAPTYSERCVLRELAELPSPEAVT